MANELIAREVLKWTGDERYLSVFDTFEELVDAFDQDERVSNELILVNW